MKLPTRIHCRDGSVAIIETLGTDGRWYGSIPGLFSATWWHPDGRHNTFRNHDLEKVPR